MQQDVTFGDYRFDVETRRLWAGEREIRLTPKASDVLKVLVTNAGRPVSKRTSSRPCGRTPPSATTP